MSEEAVEDWVLSGASVSAASTSSSTSSSSNDAVEPVSQLRRGRKTGELHPDSRRLRDRLLRECGVWNELFDDNHGRKQPALQQKAQDVPVSQILPAFSRLQRFGNSVYNSVVDMVQASECNPCSEAAGEAEVFLRHFFDQQRAVAPRKVESGLLGMSDRTLKRRIQEAAAVGHVISKLHCASLASLLLTEMERGTIKLHGVITTTSFDETPLPMRSCRSQEHARLNVDRQDVTIPSNWAEIVESNQLMSLMKDQGTMKIVQSNVLITCVFEEEETQQMRCWNMPLPCPLAVVDRATASTMAANLLEQLTIPALEHLRAKAEFWQDISVRDSAPANLGCDEILYAVGGDALRLRVPCGAHGTSNAQGYAFQAMQTDISGMIACALAMRPGGSTQTLRASIAVVLERSVHVHVAQPPPPDDCRALYRKALFDLCLRSDGAGLRRRSNLEMLLNGDLQSEEVHVYMASETVELDARAWSEAVAELLLPAAIPVFPRSAFSNSNCCKSS